MKTIDSFRVPSDAAIQSALLDALAQCGPGKTAGPQELARTIIAQLEEPLHAAVPASASGAADWHLLLAPIRRAAVGLARDGRVVIYRKGKPVDPSDFKGVYRIGLPRHD